LKRRIKALLETPLVSFVFASFWMMGFLFVGFFLPLFAGSAEET